jgi:GT2 family glycosyltransferase
MDLSIIIVNWNSREHLKKCLASILTQAHKTTYEIIVIDSASFDGCDEMLREHYPQVRFIQSVTNLGFARANNHAFQESIGECVLFLNPDTEIVGPALDTLYATLNSLPDSGIVGCKLLNSDRTIQTSCIQAMPTILSKILDSEFLRARWPKSTLWGMAPLFETSREAREVEAISGACLMLRRSTFQQVGAFSDDYFMYAEDVDLSYKVRLAGYRNYYAPDATIIHHGGGSSDQAVSTFAAVMMPEATRRFFCKTRGGAYGFGFRLAMLGSAIARLAVLGASFPVWRMRYSVKLWRDSVQKWLAILKWGLNRDELVKRYYPVPESIVVSRNVT